MNNSLRRKTLTNISQGSDKTHYCTQSASFSQYILYVLCISVYFGIDFAMMAGLQNKTAGTLLEKGRIFSMNYQLF